MNEWGHGSPFFVSNLGGLILSFALQHHPKSQWFSDLWGPLHLTHFDPWILHKNVTWPHFQQFLHWGTPGFMFASQIVAICLLTLKHLLISIFALLPLWTSQMSIYTIDMSDLGDTLITLVSRLLRVNFIFISSFHFILFFLFLFRLFSIFRITG